MRQYEMSVLIHPDLEMDVTPATDKVKKLVEDNGGKILKETADGKRRLAYPIEKQNFAVYYYYDVELPPEAIDKISSTLNITDEVLRYLLVTADPRREKIEARRKARRAAKTENNEINEEV